MAILAPAPAPPRRFPRWLRLFEPSPAAATITSDPAVIREGFRLWQRRILVSTIIGYATFYFVRKNLSVAMPSMMSDLHLTESDLGLFITLHGIIYGVSKFANGFFADRCNARAFMVVGLAVSALLNLFFGLGHTALALGVVWMLNGWFQGMGFPPCARLLAHWFSPKTFATKMSIWNISHSLGACLILILCGSLLAYGAHWRFCFFVPAGIAILCAFYLWLTLPDTPASVGLPEAEGTRTELPPPETNAEFRAVVLRAVLRNPHIWLVSVANFFVYILRYAILDWGPTLLTRAKHLSIGNASWIVAGFEAAGVVGALLSGWLTDRFFGGRPMRAGVFFMVMAGLSLLLFWQMAGESPFWNTALLCAAGFFIYGPQCLIGITAAKLATKQAAATAVGLTGFFGYLSTVVSGYGLGWTVQHYGWDTGFAGLLVVAIIGTVLFVAAWKAKAHGYAA